MRGKGLLVEFLVLCKRITPAYAGKSSLYLVPVRASRDHPRACGEKELLELLQNPRHGITPAHAGKRPPRSTSCFLPWDHPRACGEKPVVQASVSKGAGSPPRMRGKASSCVVCRPSFRITPAHAGKSTGPRRCAEQTQDHPRACGEKFFDYLMKGMI